MPKQSLQGTYGAVHKHLEEEMHHGSAASYDDVRRSHFSIGLRKILRYWHQLDASYTAATSSYPLPTVTKMHSAPSHLTLPSAPQSLPVVDITGLRNPELSEQRAVAQQLRQACEHRGFFYITGHGIDPELIRAVFTASQNFFAQSLDIKQRINKMHSACNRGFEPLRAQTLEAGGLPDLKESFYIGPEVAANDPRVLAGRFNTGPNQWPDELPGFRDVMQQYFDAAYELGSTLVRGLALSLDLPANYFDAYLEEAAATLRLLHYPPQPANPHPGEKGCGEHTDFGCLTLLLQDQTGGLQVWDTAHQAWVDAPPMRNAFVVNIGDLMARWTNDRYVSTLHRVINVSGKERYSVPFFFTGNPLHVVECIPTCLQPGTAPKYPPVTVEAHQRECYRRTYGTGFRDNATAN